MLRWALMPNFNAVAHLVCHAECPHPDRQTSTQTDIWVKTKEHLSTKVAALCAERVRTSRTHAVIQQSQDWGGGGEGAAQRNPNVRGRVDSAFKSSVHNPSSFFERWSLGCFLGMVFFLYSHHITPSWSKYEVITMVTRNRLKKK